MFSMIETLIMPDKSYQVEEEMANCFGIHYFKLPQELPAPYIIPLSRSMYSIAAPPIPPEVSCN